MLTRHELTRHELTGPVRPLRAAAVPLAALLLAALTACSGGSSAADKDGADTTGKGGGGKSAAPQDKALAFSKCMREHGVDKFPDPAPGGGIKLTPQSGVDMQSSTFKKAQEACKKFSPQGDAGSGAKLDPTKVAAWAECIRDHGVPKLRDPEVQGNAMVLELGGTGIEPQGSKFQKAMAACRSKAPQGGIMFKNGQAGQ